MITCILMISHSNVTYLKSLTKGLNPGMGILALFFSSGWFQETDSKMFISFYTIELKQILYMT